MKILLCTNQYQKVSNGPVKFARMLKQLPYSEVRILTEDCEDTSFDSIYPLFLKPWQKKSPFSQVIRMWLYHREAMRIKSFYDFDALVYCHALVGVWSAYWFSSTIGMINDDRYARRINAIGLSLRDCLKYFFFRRVERLMYRRCHKVIVNSAYLYATLQAAYGSREKVYVLYKGVDLREEPLKEISFEQPIKLLFVKSDFETGGLQDLLEALALVNFQYELHLVGNSPTLKDFVLRHSEASIPNNITFHHYLTPEQLNALLGAIHIVCVPSHRESLGVVNMEALAAGISVVTTNVGGIAEVLDGGKNGWMVNPAQKEQLAAALNECVAQPALRQMKRENGLLYVKRFEREEMYRRFQCIVEQP